MSIDWSKAPAHATHWCPGNARIEEGWIYKAGQEFYSCYAEKSCEHIPNFPAWRALRLIPRPVEPAPWNGKGLPPVGTVCEIAGSAEFFHNRHPEGVKVKIYAHFTDDRGVELAAFTDDIGQVGGVGIAKCFRQIRTPEQIAAEEREASIKAMMALNPDENPNQTLSKWLCEALYDAGYRKQVTP